MSQRPLLFIIIPIPLDLSRGSPRPTNCGEKRKARRKAAFTIPPAAAGDIYFVRADRRGLIKRKKERPRRKAIFTIPPATAGNIYFVRAVRPWINKHKKRSPRRKTIFTIPPAVAGGIIKHKKRKPLRAFFFLRLIRTPFSCR